MLWKICWVSGQVSSLFSSQNTTLQVHTIPVREIAETQKQSAATGTVWYLEPWARLAHSPGDRPSMFSAPSGTTRVAMSTNAQNFSYRLKVNEFADLTTCEFVS